MTVADLSELVLESELGRGAYTSVFLARRGDDRYAVKLLRGAAADSPDAVLDLRREAALLASLDHPGILRTYASGLHEGRPALVTELVPGESLASLLANGPLAVDRVVQLARELADALAAAHRGGVVHRDLKPQNVMVPPVGPAKLIDFGLAGMASQPSDADTATGTFVYAAPEQTGMLKRPVDHRSDLYSLGVVLYECLTGRPPFQANNVGELLRMHAVQAVPDVCGLRPEAGAQLGAVITRLLAKDPDDRYRGAPELLADLARCCDTGDAAPVTASDRWPLCGRQAEMEVLRTRWESARAGRGGMALVRGPAGGGRSHLAQALADVVADAGGAVLSARCAGESGPLAAVREAVEKHLADVAALPRTDPAHQRVRDAAMTAGAGLVKALSPRLAAVLADVPEGATAGEDQFAQTVAVFLAELARGGAGALLVLDDAHDLDERSGQVLARLADLLPGTPMLVVLTAAEGAPAAPLRAAYGAVLDTEVVTGALGQGATAELISSRLPGAAVNPALTAHVLARTGGLPLAVVEYLRALVDKALLAPYWGTWKLDDSRLDALPAAGKDLLVSRIADLPAEVVDVLVVAACIGNRFRGEVLAAAAERRDGEVTIAIEAATAQRLLEVREDGRYGFVHAGVRTALLDSADADRVRRLHRRIAQVVEAQDPATRDAEHAYSVADHYVRGAGDGDEAALYRALVVAGQTALADGSPAEALRFLERAEEAARAGSLPVASEVRHAIVTATLRVGRVDSARDRIEQALKTETDPWWRAKLWNAMAEVHTIEYADDQAVAAASTALAELGHATPSGRIRLVLSTIGAAIAGSFVRRTGIGFGTVRGRQREEFLIRASLLEACAYGSVIGMRVPHVLVYVLRTLYLVNRLGPGPHFARAYALLGLVPALIGRRRPAERCWALAAGAARDLADPVLVAFVDWVRGTGLLFGGHDDGGAWEKAVEKHARLLAPAQLLGGFGTVVIRLLLRGRPVEAAAALQQCESLLPGTAGRINGTSIGMARVMVPAQQGHSGEAAAALATMRASIGDGAAVAQRANLAVAALHSLVEQGEFGAPFDEAIAEFEAIGLRRSGMMAIHKYFFLFLAHGRLAQCRLAPAEERPARIAVARRAIKDLGRHADTPLLKVGHQLARAGFCQLTGDPAGALELADTAEQKARPLDSPLVTLEASRIRARSLRALGITGEAQRQARLAYSIATSYGLEHRAQQIRAEFGEVESSTAAGGTSHRTRERARERDLEAMQRVALAAATVLDPRELARVTLAETLRIFGAERALFFLVGDDDRLALYAGLDATGAELDAVSDFGSTLLNRVRRSGEPLVVTGTEEGAALGSRSVVAHGLRSIMVAPVQLKARLLGVVYLDSRLARGVFTEEDIDVLATVTSHVAVALQTARAAQLELAVQVAIRQQELAETLRSSLAELSAILDPQEVLHRLAGTLVEQAGASRSCLLRAGDSALTVVTATGPGTVECGYEVTLAGDLQTADLVTTSLVSGGWAANAPAVVAEVLGDPAAWLVVPLRSREGLVAVLFLGGEQFDDGHRQVVSTLAGQGMSAYDNAELFSRVERLATTDGLTGIANRRHAFQLGETLFGVARRSRRPLTAVMADIDHFKTINDRYGHGCGDDVIRDVAARLGGVIRSSDVLGRYGGEEFLIILPEAGDGGAELAERMRAAVAAEPVPTRTGPVTVTISVGLASLDPDDDILDTLVARADHALYLAKEGGRNRVAMA